MKRIVEYQIPKGKFDALVKHLKEEGSYSAHEYREMGKGTIDDGRSTSFEVCQRFSVFQELEGGRSVKLRVEDSQLAKTVDLYFANER